MFTSIILIIGGLLACYGLIVAQAPHLKDELDKVIPFQGFVGVILILLGLYDLLAIKTVIILLQNSPLLGIIQIAGTLSKFVLGFVLSYGLVTKYLLTEKTTAQEKSQNIYNTLLMVQVPFGIIGIIVGIIGIIFNIIY